MNYSEKVMLAQALSWQPEMASPELLERFSERLPAYLAGDVWREEDIRLIWSSPIARRRLLDMRAALARETEGQWDAQGFGRSFNLRAASGDDDHLVLGDANIMIEIVRAPASGDWLIRAFLSADARAAMPSALAVRLEDSGGLQWLSGKPDRHGGLDTIWDSEGVSPIERLRNHSLLLKLA